MRVLHVHSGNLFGGVETFLLTLARCRHMTPAMEMSVALSFDGPVGARLRAEGIATPLLGEVRLRRIDTVWRARKTLASLLAADRFDAVVCHQSWPHAIFGPVIKAAGVPFASWIHMASTGSHWLDRLAWRTQPDCFITNSHFSASVLPPTTTRVETIYYPVEQTAAIARGREVVRQEHVTAADDVVIVQVSRMERWKGQALCLQALGTLRERPGWTCWQVGGAQRPAEARYLASLRADAARMGISDRVRFLGQSADVRSLLFAADVFCQPNLEPEPFGISFIEALGAGLPVVATAFGGALEIVDKSCGVLVPPADADALAGALSGLIDRRDTREQLGHGGPARARALCDPSTQMRRIADLLNDVACRQAVHECN
jgi:glycosyltransferase involved in cell wall biosynthesis